MSLNASAMAFLVSKGLDADDLVTFALLMEERRDTAAAERMRRLRAKRKESEQVTANVTANKVPNDIYSNPPTSPSIVSNETIPPVENENDLKPEHVVEAWNATAQRNGLREVRKFTPQRRRKLASRIRQNTIDEFTEAISAIERSAFLRGENDRGWRATFDWMLEPSNFTKLIEGTYDR